MSGFTENMAHDASEKPEGRDPVMNLATAQRMLPLVRRIVNDVLQHRQRLDQLEPEQERLDRKRHTLAWPERARRYQVREELAATALSLQEFLAELEVLGVALISSADGRVGFPTIVNDRPAFFSWQHGEEGVRFWHFAGEHTRRPIPAAWENAAHMDMARK